MDFNREIGKKTHYPHIDKAHLVLHSKIKHDKMETMNMLKR